MASKSQIKAAVEALDGSRDDHWTQSGLPSVDAVSSALGERVTREDINAASGRVREQGGSSASAQPGEPGDLGGSDRTNAEGEKVPELKAAQPAGNDTDGPDPETVFGMMDEIVAAASSPRWRRNQVLQQIRTLWANEQQSARAMQEKMEGRIERRAEKREARAEREDA